jgi:tetratricopeptide (TPR) repeat protein
MNEWENSAMSIRQKLGAVALLSAIFLPAPAPAVYPADPQAMDGDVGHIESEWARIKYRVADHDEQLREIEALANEAAAIVARYPKRAEPLLWEGIVTSEEAAMAGMFRQLGLATAALRIFQQAEAIDPTASHGAVLMSIGVVYYRVPGFPIGFGDDRKARHYLETALAMDPDGLDANYFYGDFLIEQGDYAKAKSVLVHALGAAPNPARSIWDAGRRADVQALIEKVNHHINH